MKLHRTILQLSLPAIITNVTVPLLGLIDIAISGHIGDSAEIGAIALGAMMFNMLYWNFTFLRMGTTGVTAQFYGARRDDMVSTTLFRALAIALATGVAILLLQVPLKSLLIALLAPSDRVATLAGRYFYICIWGAPAMLCTSALKGWYIGMQNSRFPMYIAVSVNVVNVAMSLLAVFVLGYGFVGIAVGTLVAQYFGIALSVALLLCRYRRFLRLSHLRGVLEGEGLGKFFRVNRDIFIRSVCLLAVTAFFTSAGARSGDTVLAANALIMQLFLVFTYFMDGFAFAGEALVGRCVGEENDAMLRRSVSALLKWGLGVTVLFAALYGGALPFILSLLTTSQEVIDCAMRYRLWCLLIPVVGVSTFIWDGVFVGLTATRQLVYSIVCASALFFAVNFNPFTSRDNHLLWISFLLYIWVRGVVLWWCYRRRMLKQ